MQHKIHLCSVVENEEHVGILVEVELILLPPLDSIAQLAVGQEPLQFIELRGEILQLRCGPAFDSALQAIIVPSVQVDSENGQPSEEQGSDRRSQFSGTQSRDG